MPSTGDSLFWLTGGLELELAGTVLLIAAATVLAARMTIRRALVAALLIILISGLHELAVLAICIALTGTCVWVYRNKRSVLWIWLLLLAIAAAGLLVVIGAPGNFIRAAQQGTTWSVISALGMTTVHMAAWIPRWLLDAPLLLAALVALLEPRLRIREEWNRAGVRDGVFAVWMALLASGFFVSTLALNGLLPGRVLNWLYFLFIAGFFVNLLLWKSHWGWFALPETVGRQARSLVLVCMFGALFFTGNPWLGAVDLALRIKPWHTARSAALWSLRSADSNRAAVLPALPETPHMYFDYDVALDPLEYPNRCVARYFGLPSVSSPTAGRWPRGAALSGRTFGLLNRP